jgi:hypothetical protein
MRSRAAIVVAAALVGCGSDVAPERTAAVLERPRAVKETCATRSMAHFPGAYTRRANLRVGPLAMMGGAMFTPADAVREFGGNKFPLLVKAGHRVTVELVGSRTAALGYGPLPQNRELVPEDGHRAVTFTACKRSRKSGSDADGAPVTFWSGSVLASEPQCVRLRVWIDREPSPRSARIELGRRCR